MNKKTYILGFIAIAFLVGIVWHADRNQEQTNKQISSILGTTQEDESSKSAINSKQLTGEYVLGNPEAPVTIIEYSSHFCSHCADFHKETLPLLIEKYIESGQVKLISRYLSPLEVGNAILCANEQNKFSIMSEHFFNNASEITTVDDVRKVALQVDLNQDDFIQCYDSSKYEVKVKEWFDQATESGVSGTPTFFINGEEITGNQPFSVFEQAIEKALE